ncbi:MAG: coxB [Gammaproteobacteria bacterium]|jgi:cytochrome c oxidase subunit 2|nr:coxB [Gammaproteobacteria bacterium]
MRLISYWRWFVSVLLLAITPYALAHGESKFNLPKGVTPISHDIYDLHMTIFWICVGIGVIVFGVMIYTLIYHRKSRGVKPAQFHEHTLVEIVWAVIPLLILVAMAIPATLVLIRMNDTTEADINIKVTGYQWKWQYEYLDHGISYFSNLSTPRDELENRKPTKGQWYLLEVDKPLVVPIHKKIRFLVTANDVVHSWWVPSLGIKRDAIPGFIYEAWARIEKPGTYRGQCAELCGVNHGFMPIVVKAVTEEEYNKWIAEQTQQKTAAAQLSTKSLTKDELMTLGKKVHDTNCAVCHKVDGSGMPPAFPAITGSHIATGPIAKHIDIVLNGKLGTAMQAFGSQLSDADIAAVVTYQRNALGNSKGDMVNTQEIKAARVKEKN